LLIAVADPEFGCVKIGSLKINKFEIKYTLQILFNPSGVKSIDPNMVKRFRKLGF